MTKWKTVQSGHFRQIVRDKVGLVIYKSENGYTGYLIVANIWTDFGFIGKTEKQAKSNTTSKYKAFIQTITGKVQS